MALKPIIEVDVDPSGNFAKFAAEYQRWKDAAANMPSLFAGTTAETDKQVKSFREMVDLAKERAIHARQTAEVEKAAHEELYGEEDRARAKLEQADREKANRERRVSSQAKEQAKAWSEMARHAKSFAARVFRTMIDRSFVASSPI